jgi:polyisoprenoid-binding protein YceI
MKNTLTFALFLAACSATTHAAPAVAAKSTTANAATAAPTTNTVYKADPTHTFVNFEVKHFGTSTLRGRFDKKEGSVTLDRTGKVGRAEFTIDMASVSTGVAALDTHLKGKDFFNASAKPTAKFVANNFTFEGNKVTSVSGTLTLLGKTLPVSLMATNFNCYDNPILKREVCGGDFETSITRSQWGMSYGLSMGLPDMIRLLIQVEAVKQ